MKEMRYNEKITSPESFKTRLLNTDSASFHLINLYHIVNERWKGNTHLLYHFYINNVQIYHEYSLLYLLS